MKYTVEVASMPDRKYWVAEIWDGKEMIAEISRDDNGHHILEVYCVGEDRSNKFDFKEFELSLREASEKLGI